MTRFLKERSLKVRLLDMNSPGYAATRRKYICVGLTPASLLATVAARPVKLMSFSLSGTAMPVSPHF